MPTYDYLCNNCNDRGEYFGVPSDGKPYCRICGSQDMQRLISGANIGSSNFRDVSSRDLSGRRKGLRFSLGLVELSDGSVNPAIKVEKITRDIGPSLN